MGDLIQPPKPHLWPAQQGKALREQVWVPRVPGSRDARVAHGDTAGQLLPHVPHLPQGQPLRELRETQVSSTKPEASPGPHGTSLCCRATQRRPSGHRQAERQTPFRSPVRFHGPQSSFVPTSWAVAGLCPCAAVWLRPAWEARAPPYAAVARLAASSSLRTRPVPRNPVSWSCRPRGPSSFHLLVL